MRNYMFFSVKAEFPEERAGIERYFELMKIAGNMIYFHHVLKVKAVFF